ncbi:MAG: efflux RND transporter periplasmic adaptor subunit [Polyangiaceae bacterium]|nr:efflux RND transporter periplasmic adaptor subunit [Polyangiaceae bacterium]
MASSWAWPVCLAGALLAVSACKRETAPVAAARDTAEPVSVETVAVREAPMPRTLSLTGSLRAEQEAEVAAGAAGRVVRVGFDRGSEVKATTILCELDVSAAALMAAEANVAAKSATVQRDSAARECARSVQLFQAGVLSQADYDRATAQCDAAELQVAAAKARIASVARNVSDGLVRAPFGGIITERRVDPGEYVMPASPVATLVAVDKLRLELYVPEAHVAATAVGAGVTFQVGAFPDRTFQGSVRVVGATVRPATRDVLLEVGIDNADRTLRPGMFAAVELALPDAVAPVVPQKSLVVRDGSEHLFVVVNERLEERVVTIGGKRGDDVAVVRGVRVGDLVVTSPSESLHNGQAVK